MQDGHPPYFPSNLPLSYLSWREDKKVKDSRNKVVVVCQPRSEVSESGERRSRNRPWSYTKEIPTSYSTGLQRSEWLRMWGPEDDSPRGRWLKIVDGLIETVGVGRLVFWSKFSKGVSCIVVEVPLGGSLGHKVTMVEKRKQMGRDPCHRH